MKAVLLALALSLSTASAPVIAVAGEASTDTPRPQPTKDEKKLISVVKDYIRNHRGWIDGSYSVELYARQADTLIFAVYFDRGDGAWAFTAAEGQSFKVEVDPKTKQVTSEQFF